MSRQKKISVNLKIGQWKVLRLRNGEKEVEEKYTLNTFYENMFNDDSKFFCIMYTDKRSNTGISLVMPAFQIFQVWKRGYFGFNLGRRCKKA